MLGRSGQRVDDEPDWREKLADWRDSPPWVFERPEWLAESPGALLLMFVGIAFAMISVVYLVVPATALPSSLPGRWVPPTTTSTASTTTTTTTTVPAATRLAALRSLAGLSEAQRQKAMGWIRAVAEFNKQEADIQKIVDAPPVPPSRRWANALIAGALAAGLLGAAWFVSDSRGRLHFRR